jgi:hypothetical protein
MRVFRESDSARGSEAVAFAAGALLGLLFGFVASRQKTIPRGLGGELRERVKGAARRLRPARRERLIGDQLELDRLEEELVEEFLRDEVLSERAIDIGAISVGIVELTGTVRTEDEAQRAVNLARKVPGVLTVVNRMDIGSAGEGFQPHRLEVEDVAATFGHQEARVGGMGRRRQSFETEPERPDDSQRLRENALAAADRAEWQEEGLAPPSGRGGESSSLRGTVTPDFDEDELDNQDPRA